MRKTNFEWRVATCTCALLAAMALSACGDDEPTSDADTGDDAAAHDADAGDSADDGDGADTGADADDADSDGDVVEAPTIEVMTTNGPVRGRARNGHVAFLGIPYAAPPTGDARFKAPTAPEPWTETLVLGGDKPDRCPQTVPVIGDTGVEDCLFVNVHVPHPTPEDAPVLVWIHGGGFTLGEGMQTDGGTAGDILAREEGIIVVSMNYRLGALGFLAHPALSAENGGVSGNYGFLDQVAALEWVRDNAAAFGGDPTRVTIAGQSAGGMSVCLHLVSEQSRPLYRGAIIMSGPCQRGFALADAEAQGERFAAELPTPCDSADDVAACLRATPLDDIMSTLPGSDEFITISDDTALWLPIIDGTVIPTDNATAFETGNFAQVPILAGYTENEGRVFATLGDTTVSAEEYEQALRDVAVGAGADPDSVVAAYPLNGDDPTLRYFDAIGDSLLTCSARASMQAISAHTDMWGYYFTYPDAGFQLPTEIDLGAFHSGEVQYIFGHPASLFESELTGDDLALHHEMRPIWGSFVRDGAPATDAVVDWPQYSGGGDRFLVLDRTLELTTAAAADRCDVWP